MFLKIVLHHHVFEMKVAGMVIGIALKIAEEEHVLHCLMVM
jgi:hypothetical protein